MLTSVDVFFLTIEAKILCMFRADDLENRADLSHVRLFLSETIETRRTERIGNENVLVFYQSLK